MTNKNSGNSLVFQAPSHGRVVMWIYWRVALQELSSKEVLNGGLKKDQLFSDLHDLFNDFFMNPEHGSEKMVINHQLLN